MTELVYILFRALQLLQLLVFIHVILSWVTAAGNYRLRSHPAVQLLDRIVEPLLAPIRSFLRPYMRNLPIDFSPLILLLGIDLVRQVLASVLLRPYY